MSRTAANRACIAALVLALSGTPHAAVIGISVPPRALSIERLQELPPSRRGEWADYLSRSKDAMAADRAALAGERAARSGPPPGAAAPGDGLASMPLDRPREWYGSPEAIRVADHIVSFQTPAGGWGKNQPRDRPPRQPGQFPVAGRADQAGPTGDPAWSYVGTIDNGATVTEIRFLAKVADRLPPDAAQPYRSSALRGLDYLLAAQFPNGGWPQVWPLQGGYHDALTLNDRAMVNAAELLGDAARSDDREWHFLPAAVKHRAADAERRAIDLLLQLQIVVDGRRTLWAQQYDALSLQPTAARVYEPAALASTESAQVLNYLMARPSADPRMDAAVDAGVSMLRELSIHGMRWHAPSEEGRRLSPQPGAPALWARYYHLATLRPIFGERDGTIHDEVDDISAERRNGYAWFGASPAKVIARYAGWRMRQR